MTNSMTSYKLIQFANRLFREQTESLTSYVRLCIRYGVPYLGFVYCLTFLNFLGSFYAGDSGRQSTRGQHSGEGGTMEPAVKYMFDLMQYSHQNVILIQKIFGQSTINILQPKPVIFEKESNRYITWKLLPNYEDKDRHLHLIKHSKSRSKKSLRGTVLGYEYTLNLSLPQLLDDILNSIYKKRTGYLHLLRSDSGVRGNFYKVSQSHEFNL